MRHIPIAEFKDKLSEFVAAAADGEEIAITRHGREMARLIPPEHDVVERRRRAFEGLAGIRDAMRVRGASASRQEVREWINEGRR